MVQAVSSKLRGKAMSQRLPVLIVDDSEICTAGMFLLLAKHGFVSQLAKSAQTALELFEPWKFSAILMDYQMVGLTGAECASEIRKRELSSGCHIPIIGITSHTDAGLMETCLTAGMDVVLSKDTREEDLIAVLNLYIESDA